MMQEAITATLLLLAADPQCVFPARILPAGEGPVKPLFAPVYGFSDIAVALHQLSAAKHVGKIEVNMAAALNAQQVRHLYGQSQEWHFGLLKCSLCF